ncbi:MAG TPA: hypothetical protein VIJ68_02610 [Candidatus Saccharimonadales bacterium]
MSKSKPSRAKLSPKLLGDLEKLRRYNVVFFLVFVAILYAFVLLRINSLNTAQPSSDAVTSQVQAANVPHIDQTVVHQIQSLQDNSVSVQSLFDQARDNPFQ